MSEKEEVEPIDKLTMKELKDIARFMNLTKGYSKMKKGALKNLIFKYCDIDGDMVYIKEHFITKEDTEKVKKENTRLSDFTKKYAEVKKRYFTKRGKLNKLKGDLPYAREKEDKEELEDEIKQLTKNIVAEEKEMNRLKAKIDELKELKKNKKN